MIKNVFTWERIWYMLDKSKQVCEDKASTLNEELHHSSSSILANFSVDKLQDEIASCLHSNAMLFF